MLMEFFFSLLDVVYERALSVPRSPRFDLMNVSFFLLMLSGVLYVAPSTPQGSAPISFDSQIVGLTRETG